MSVAVTAEMTGGVASIGAAAVVKWRSPELAEFNSPSAEVTS